MASGRHDIGNNGAKVAGADDGDLHSLIAHEGLPQKERPRYRGAAL